MLSTSGAFRTQIASSSAVTCKATLTLADGTVYELTDDDLMAGGMSIDDAVSSTSEFEVGAAIIGQLSLTLNNYDERFNDFDFTDAVIVPYVGVDLPDGTTEWLRKGEFVVEQPETYGNTISIIAYDYMSKFETNYSEVGTTYPATLYDIVSDICSACDVYLGDSAFDNGDYEVPYAPDDDSLTCLAVLSYAAQAAGCWARFDNYGQLHLDWYDTSVWETEWEDDGTTGAPPYKAVDATSSLTVALDDVVITGIQVTASDVETEDEDSDTTTTEGETSLYGSEGYVLSIESNPLIQAGEAETVATMIGGRVVGMRFRPFQVSAIGDPSVEAGDPILLTDMRGRSYQGYATSLTYKVGNYESYNCSAETPSRNKADTYSALTAAIVAARNAVKTERTERQKALDELAEKISESNGLYLTMEEQEDGSIIYYLHDQPELADSEVIWKMTSDAIAVSTDGGETYDVGLTADGTAILDRVYAIGIDASYITTGIIKAQSGDSYINLDTGEWYITSEATIDALANYATTSYVQQTANSVTSSVTEMLGNYATSSELSQTANSLTATFTASTGSNLLVDGGFEDADYIGSMSSGLALDSDDPHSGSYCLACTGSAHFHFNHPYGSAKTPGAISVEPGETYYLSMWVKASDDAVWDTNNMKLRVGSADGNDTLIAATFGESIGTEWEQKTATWTNTAGYTEVYVRVHAIVTSGTVWCDDCYFGVYTASGTLIRASGNGVEVGLYEDGSYTGSRTRMNETGFYVLNSAGSVHAAMNTGGIYFLPNGTSAANIQSTHLALGYSAVASGTNAVAIGASSNASATNAIAMGVGAVANGNSSVAIGYGSTAMNVGAFAIGYLANASGSYSIALRGNASGNYSASLGAGSNASGNYAVSLGRDSTAAGTNSIALGVGATAGSANNSAATALGRSATASGTGATALGYNATASGLYGSALCYGSAASGTNSLALGYGSTASAANATALGRSATASVAGATALGYNATASSNNGIAIGFSSQAGFYGVAIGPGAVTSNNQAVAVGYEAYANMNGSVAIGILSNVYGNYGVAVGYNSCAGANVAGYTVAVGSAVRATGNYAVAIGGYADASAATTTAVGYNAIANAEFGTAVGHQATAWGTNAVAYGTGSSANINATAVGRTAQALSSGSVSVGSLANAAACYATALGRSAIANAYMGTALGHAAHATANCAVGVGRYAYCANVNGIQLGNATYTSTLTCKVSLTTTSDERDKADLVEVTDATAFLRNVTAYTFVFNQRETYHYPEDELTDEQLGMRAKYGLYAYDADAWAAGTRKGERRRIGVSAQEVQAALESTYGSADYANLVNDNLHDFEEVPEDVESQLAVNYEGFVPFLVEAFKELDARVTALEGGS